MKSRLLEVDELVIVLCGAEGTQVHSSHGGSVYVSFDIVGGRGELAAFLATIGSVLCD